jgi:hypothetical protein
VRRQLAAIGLGLLAALASFTAPTPAKDRVGYTHGVANAALVAAAKATPLKLIDYDQNRCRNDRTVQAWLKELTAGAARAIAWTGGACELVDSRNPIDSGSDWCAQARILLKHPHGRHDTPMVEIYFDTPTRGKPSPAYAFRGDMADDGGPIRFREDFETGWLARFPANTNTIRCPDDG